MSSGRGRGRGGGGKRGAPPSASKLLLIRSVEESGLDDKNLKSLHDITKPALFPEMTWNIGMNGDHHHHQSSAAATTTTTTTGPLSATSAPISPSTTATTTSFSSRSTRSQSSTIYLINKGREIDHRIQTSSHWVRPSQTQVDVVRYQSDKKSHRFLDAQMPPDIAVLAQMGKNLAMNTAYIPSELIPSNYSNNNNNNSEHGNNGNNSRKRSLNDSNKINSNNASSTAAPNVDDENVNANERTTKRPATLEELEKKEIERRKMEETRRANLLLEENENGGGGNLSDIPPEDEEEEVEDYTMNYYASEDESDGGGGGDAEATF